VTDFGADAVLVCRTRSRGDGALGGDVPWRWVGRDWSWGKASVGGRGGGGLRRRWGLEEVGEGEGGSGGSKAARKRSTMHEARDWLVTSSGQKESNASSARAHRSRPVVRVIEQQTNQMKSSVDLHRRRANAVLSTLCFVLQNHFARITLRPADFLSGLDRGQTEDAKCRISRAALGVFAFDLILKGDSLSKHAGSAGLLSHLGTVIAKG
jgi:hypothetical protein